MALRSFRSRLVVVIALSMALAACGSDTASVEATTEPAAAATSEEAEATPDVVETPTTEAAEPTVEAEPTVQAEPTTAEPTAGDAATQDSARDAALAAYTGAGLSAESAACVVDGYAAAGVSAEEMLAVIVENQAPTDTEAFAAGSASIDECLSPEEQQALDSGVAEQDPEALRADYSSALITITDLNEQQAGCVVDAISDAGFDMEEIVASGVVSDELQTATDLFIDICSS